MAILAERYVHVIGVDTHKRSLTAAVLNSIGGVLESCEVPANAVGHAHLLAMAAGYAGPMLWAVEGTGSYGASLTEQLVGAGHVVTEVDRPRRPARKHGKSDQIDAVRAGREALAMKQLNPPRRRGAGAAPRAPSDEGGVGEDENGPRQPPPKAGRDELGNFAAAVP